MKQLFSTIRHTAKIWIPVIVIIPMIMAGNIGQCLVYAISTNDYESIINNLPFYDPNDPWCSQSASGSSVQVTGADAEAQAMNFLVSKGLSAYAAAGIIGNLMVESGMDPSVEQVKGSSWTDMNPNDYGYGVGIAQWDGGRRVALIKAAEAKGITLQQLQNYSHDTSTENVDLSFELNYLWNELNNDYPQVLTQLKTVTDATTAADIFEYGYEVAAGGGDITLREKDAALVYKQDAANSQQYANSAAGATTDTAPSCASANGTTTTGNEQACPGVGSGTGPFTNTNTKTYPNVAAMCARAEALTKVAVPPDTCETQVENAWLGHAGIYSAAVSDPGDPQHADWATQLTSGHAHAGDMNPPVGALLFWNSVIGGIDIGHVAIYLGNNMIMSTDVLGDGHVYITNANAVQKYWGLSYVGWSDPYFLGVGVA